MLIIGGGILLLLLALWAIESHGDDWRSK